MAWASMSTYISGDVPNESEFDIVTNNVNYLHGSEAGQTEIHIENVVKAPSFRSDSSRTTEARLRHVMPTTEAFFDFVADNDEDSTITDDHSVVGRMRLDDDSGANEPQVELHWVRNTLVGELRVRTYDSGAKRFDPDVHFMTANRIGVKKEFPNYKLDVNGDVKATNYKINGVDVGIWTDAGGGKFTFAGSASVSGTWTTDTLTVNSNTKCTNLNMALLQGYDWPTSYNYENSGSATITKGLPDPTIASFTAGVAGFYDIKIEASVAVDALDAGTAGFEIYTDVGTISGDGFTDVSGDVLHLSAIGRYEAAASEVVSMKATKRGASAFGLSVATGSITARWVAP